MAWIRQLPSGKWAATVYTPLGDRVTQSSESKGMITAWAKRMESDKATGAFIDPRLGKVTIGEIWDMHAADRRLEPASQKRDQTHWNKWVEPTWGKRQVGPARKPHVASWVADMERQGAKGWTTAGALKVLKAMFEIAVDLELIAHNPCKGVKTAPPDPHEDRVLEEWEDDILLSNLEARFPGQPDAGLFVETLLYTGVRYEELAALDRSRIRPRERGFWVHRVIEKSGRIRDYGKSASAIRFVPLDDDLWPRFAEHSMSIEPDGLLFTGPGPKRHELFYDNWLKRIWYKGLLRVEPWTDERIEQWKEERKARGERPWRFHMYDEVPILDDPQPTPHDCRHTFGTRCAENGMPRHELAATLGHSPKGNAVDRYLHAREKRLERAREAMAAVRRQRSPGRPGKGHCVQCGQLLPMSYDLEKLR